MQDYYSQYLGLLTETPDLICFFDLNGLILRASNKMAENYAFLKGPTEMIGKCLFEILQCDEAQEIRKFMDEIIETRKIIADKIRHFECAGQSFFHSISMFPLFEEDDEICGFCIVLRDITARIKIEENYKSFYMTTAHDIKNPLLFGNRMLRRVIEGKLGLIDENVKATLENLLIGYDQAEKGCVETIVRMRSLGLNEKTFATKNCKIDVGLEILLQLFNKHEKALDEKRITIDNRMHSIPPGEVIMKTDRNLLYSVFNNLFDNAIKYGRIGGVISVGYHIPVGGEEVIFNVYDDGDPPSEEFVNERMGKKFQRDSETEDGTGIGLCSVIESVRMLGGRFWYNLTESGHPNFLFALPLSDMIT